MKENRTVMIPGPAAARTALADTIVSSKLPEELIRRFVGKIHRGLLAHSRYVQEADFTAIHPHDLEYLFDAYDQRFFAGLCRRALDGSRLTFRLSPRMTRAGGKTTWITTRAGEVSYEIAVAVSTLFDAFGKTDRRVSVCGLDCENRLEALQRIFEHEMVHLIEQLCWDASNCLALRFQEIAQRFFLHRAHTHDLVTRRERAALSGIRAGSRVTFSFEGRRVMGRVNRITKRATVLVEHPEGEEYSDGRRYKKYYVPFDWLEPARDE